MAELLQVFAMGASARRNALARSATEANVVAPEPMSPSIRKLLDENGPAVGVFEGETNATIHSLIHKKKS